MRFGKERWMRHAARHGGWGGEWGGRHFGGGRHGGMGRRLFGQGDLRLVALTLIAEQPRHGYEIIKEIEDRLGGGYAPSPGVIYPLLTMLEELGLITQSATEGAKKLYSITPEGQAELDANKGVVDTLFARIASLRESFAGARPPQVVRAVENLKTALRLKTERGALSDAQVQAIAAAIDGAATAIEQA